MSKINDGGPAFARASAEHNHGGNYEQDGMSLRDYFAGQALAGSCAYDGGGNMHSLSKYCYDIADAMIAARDKGGAK